MLLLNTVSAVPPASDPTGAAHPMGLLEQASHDPAVAQATAALDQAQAQQDVFLRTTPNADQIAARTVQEYLVFALCVPALGGMAMASHVAPIIGALPALSLMFVLPAVAVFGLQQLGKARARGQQHAYDAQAASLQATIQQRQSARDVALEQALQRLWQTARNGGPPDPTIEDQAAAVVINGVRVERQAPGPPT